MGPKNINFNLNSRYLLEYQANVSAVNNDGELAIDISESDEMEELLQKEIDKQGINCDESRNTEERLMLEDARSWLNAKVSLIFCSSHFSFLVFGHFWQRSSENTKTVRNLCLHFARQDGKNITQLK